MNYPLNFALSRDSYGRLIFTSAGETHVGVVAVRAFPITAPDHGISLLDADGHELLWITQLSDLPSAIQTLLAEELTTREFMPQIRHIKNVSSFATPSVWLVETDRGDTRFTLKGEEDIRRLNHNTLLIADSHGIQFLINDLTALDRYSRKLLDRFL